MKNIHLPQDLINYIYSYLDLYSEIKEEKKYVLNV